MNTSVDTIVLKKRIKVIILLISGFGILPLLLYSGILSILISNLSIELLLKAVLIVYSIFAIPTLFSFLTAKASIANHTLYYKGKSPSILSFRKSHTIALSNVVHIETKTYGRDIDVADFTMADGKTHKLCTEYFLKKDLFHALNHSFSSAIVPNDSAPEFSMLIHPVTGLFSGSRNGVEICINGQPISCDTATGVYQCHAHHGDLISIRRGDSFVFRYLDESEDVYYVLDHLTLIKTSPEDVKSTVKLKRADNFFMGVFSIGIIVAVVVYGNKALWGFLVLPLMFVISKLIKRKK